MSGSICDAILTPAPGDLTFPILKAHCGAGLVVSDAEALRAMALALRYLKIVLEPGGAVALASAILQDHGPGDIITVATGGNADGETVKQALAEFDDAR